MAEGDWFLHACDGYCYDRDRCDCDHRRDRYHCYEIAQDEGCRWREGEEGRKGFF